MLTLDNYLLSCGGGDGRVGGCDSGGGGGRVDGGGGDGRVGGCGSDCNSSGGGRVSGGSSGGSGSGCGWLWLLFIVMDILFYYSRYVISL